MVRGSIQGNDYVDRDVFGEDTSACMDVGRAYCSYCERCFTPIETETDTMSKNPEIHNYHKSTNNHINTRHLKHAPTIS